MISRFSFSEKMSFGDFMGHGRKKVTIKDVALYAGVSVGAVSRVLQGRSSTIRISESTSERIRDAAKELGYEPNSMAQSLRSGRTNIVAIGSNSELDFAGKDGLMLSELISEFEKKGFSLMLNGAYIGESAENTKFKGHFDAVIWLGSTTKSSRDFFENLSVPVIPIEDHDSSGVAVAAHLVKVLSRASK